jgi:subtilisin family serine protease
MLFMVAADNHDRNIDQQPVYPAAFDLDNMIVVTSATAEGQLTMGVNWGPTAVDLMVPGEGVLALDFNGERRWVSGSSYAAARATALAACLLADHPEWCCSGFVPVAALANRGACARQQLACPAGAPIC